MGTAHFLLFDALNAPSDQARESWRQWRTAADIDKLDYESFVMLPTLSARLEPWLDGDPYGSIIKGICRRAWSQNQVRWQTFQEASNLLSTAGIREVAVIGPLAWSICYWPERAIRPVGSVDLLTQPACVSGALEVLMKAGYSYEGPPRQVPFDASSGPAYFSPPVALESPAGAPLRLHWRAMTNSAFSLRRQPRLTLLPVKRDGVELITVTPEEALVSALSGLLEDGVDWRCDAAMIIRYATLDWSRVASHLRWRAAAHQNLSFLAASGFAKVPRSVLTRSWASWLDPAAALLRLYRLYRSALR